MSDFEANTKDLQKQLETKDERIEQLIKEESKPGHVSRNSMGSDGDDYSSVSEMRDNLKQARMILSQFLQKLPYSTTENEAMLPVICSMFEFTKDE